MLKTIKRGAIGAAALCVLLAGSAPALAWGKTGHRISGRIAETHLSGQARAKIALLLGNESLADAAVWADEMRSNPDPFWQETAGPFHYVTVPDPSRPIDVATPPEGDALTALEHFAATVRDPRRSRAEKQLALRFIIHIIGDLHQPLHAGGGTDRGGNDVTVTFFGRATNLHSVWDTALVDDQQLSFTEYSDRLMRMTSANDVIGWWSADPRVWIMESVSARAGVYPDTPELSYDYVYRQRPLVEQRLQQAGIRVAAYLNALFG